MPYWNLTASASDANRACIRLSRMVTGRPRVLVFSGCYHGSVEEAHVVLRDGAVQMRNGIHPNAFPHEARSRVFEFNDMPALEAALRAGDVACVLAEPVMTNFGLIATQRRRIRSTLACHGASSNSSMISVALARRDSQASRPNWTRTMRSNDSNAVRGNARRAT